MTETPQSVLEAWIGMGDRPTDAEMSLVTLERVREAIRAVLAENDALRTDFLVAVERIRELESRGGHE